MKMLAVILLLTQSLAYSKNCDKDFQYDINFDVPAERVYYVGCVEEDFDYAPSGENLVTGTPITEDSPEATWLFGNGVDRVGSVYKKALYRAFTDNCFDEQLDLGKKYEHLGAIGPAIRGIVGETIKVFFKNMCTQPYSMHPHGVFYEKASEGAPYVDSDGITGGDIVEPDGQWIYIWDARKTNVDPTVSSQMWLYHSHVDEVRDIITGLIGPIIITRKGFETSNTDLMPRDVTREFTTFFVLYDENDSWLMQENWERLSNPPPLSDPDFVESNLMHSINGLMFGNLDTLTCIEGETVRWYTASFGNEADGPHSPHWHGNIAEASTGGFTDTVVLIPGTTSTITMDIDDPGQWLYHCHVFDHIIAGMITTYTAEPPKTIGHGKYCCKGRKKRMAGRCMGITNEDICDEEEKYCNWDSYDCQYELTCDIRGQMCAGIGDNNCCSGYCNRYNECS